MLVLYVCILDSSRELSSKPRYDDEEEHVCGDKSRHPHTSDLQMTVTTGYHTGLSLPPLQIEGCLCLSSPSPTPSSLYSANCYPLTGPPPPPRSPVNC
ncbi:hypothetical protein J6590_068472 [Homalodisca vitripennis]|nr:hypothetical protein J6590_068472 [Homalodisca vitripennis]